MQNHLWISSRIRMLMMLYHHTSSREHFCVLIQARALTQIKRANADSLSPILQAQSAPVEYLNFISCCGEYPQLTSVSSVNSCGLEQGSDSVKHCYRQHSRALFSPTEHDSSAPHPVLLLQGWSWRCGTAVVQMCLQWACGSQAAPS